MRGGGNIKENMASECADKWIMLGPSYGLLNHCGNLPLQELNYIADDFHPDKNPPSVTIRDENIGFEVPLDLLPPNGTLSNGYSITVYFRKSSTETNG